MLIISFFCYIILVSGVSILVFNINFNYYNLFNLNFLNFFYINYIINLTQNYLIFKWYILIYLESFKVTNSIIIYISVIYNLFYNFNLFLFFQYFCIIFIFLFCLSLTIWTRAAGPRVRPDQLLNLITKNILSVLIFTLILICIVIFWNIK